jgi:hypothetical protein
MKSLLITVIVTLFLIANSYSNNKNASAKETPFFKEVIYDEKGCNYTSYKNLVMAGYQGWFTAEGDGAERGWRHYQKKSCGGFTPGCTSVDFWPDMKEYPKKYTTPFSFANGDNATLFSPIDEETVDLHFKWMKEYGIDGVFMQRFVNEVKKSNPKGKAHFNKVLQNALYAANKYNKAICVMYDLSGCTSADLAYVQTDWEELQRLFSLFNNTINPNYLRHNKKPLVVIWGVGFKDGRKYTIADVDHLVDKIKGPTKKVSVMLGVPYYWRTLKKDTENDSSLHAVIKKCDIIMPWAVGRYNQNNYDKVAMNALPKDIQWCKDNNVDYVPLVFPGFSWGNLKNNTAIYNAIPRNEGDFFWKQVAGAKLAGAQSLYVAMFDEIDEGTSIFKCLRENELPLNGKNKFVGIENNLDSDYYLWLTGKAGNWVRGETGYSTIKPIRYSNH